MGITIILKASRMKTLKIIITLTLVLGLAVGSYYLFGNYSDGYRAGIMIKFSKRGTLLKTYEGELNLGMVIREEPQDLSVSNLWRFSVPSSNDDVIKKLEDALLSGKRVKVHYNEKFVKLPWRGDTKYFIDEVEIVK